MVAKALVKRKAGAFLIKKVNPKKNGLTKTINGCIIMSIPKGMDLKYN